MMRQLAGKVEEFIETFGLISANLARSLDKVQNVPLCRPLCFCTRVITPDFHPAS